jgi:2-polyprenyl-3-methyl-5-hydroxy-6-metoxy-1,4-benzoquinol methylase
MSEFCHICHAQAVVFVDGFASFSRVTSDCRPWSTGGKLGICHSCDTVQKIVDSRFHQDCETIYNSYSISRQGRGREQKVFDQSQGQSQFRSERLLTEVLNQFDLPVKGHLLDIGCGNGNLLQSFSRLHPSWILSGSEINTKYKSVVEDIKNVEAFYTCNIENIPGRFNIITMLHSLEHIVDPIAHLEKLHQKLFNDGLLLVHVPNYAQNPFDLLITDHCTHFSIENLMLMLQLAGFEIIIASDQHIHKELTILARKTHRPDNPRHLKSPNSSHQYVIHALRWLKQTIHHATEIAFQGKFGLFGTSIAAIWLCNELGDAVGFFADEDLQRTDQNFIGRNVYHPKHVPQGWNVYIALPYPTANRIWKRMQIYDANFHLPPVFELKYGSQYKS